MLSTASETTPKARFHAVIAYVPEEFVWCDWLHRQLNDISIPPALAGGRTRHGFARPALLQVFPDPRDPVHVARCANSLPTSRYLIVVVSPHSAKSQALDAQIRSFKQSGSDDRIVVLVADGTVESGASGSDWLPTWLSWRVDEKGGFRDAEEGEPLIIDVRADRLPLPEARARVLAALLDVGRDELRKYDDLVSSSAASTLEPAGETMLAPLPSLPVYTSESKSMKNIWIGGAAAAAIVAMAAGFVVSRTPHPAGEVPVPSLDSISLPVAEAPTTPVPKYTPPKPEPQEKPVAVFVPTPTPAPSVAAVQPTPAPQATPTPTVVAAVSATPTPAPTPKALATPVAPAAAQPKPVAIATPTPAPKATVPAIATKPIEVVSATKTAATTPAEPTAKPAAATPTAPATATPAPEPAADVTAQMNELRGSDWRRMRDLGDNLFQSGRKDEGLLALAEATERANKEAQKTKSGSEQRLEAARLGFRVGALQKQNGNASEARKTLDSARSLVASRSRKSKRSSEDRELQESIDALLKSLGR